MEIELTSTRPDGTWTWRAAGARQPKGELDGSLLHTGAKVGDVVRVDADVQLEGVTINAVLPPKAARKEPERLEIIAPVADGRVTTSLQPGSRRSDDRPRRERGGDRRERGGERRDDRRPRQDRPGGAEGGRGTGDGRAAARRGGTGPGERTGPRSPRSPAREPAPEEKPAPAPKPKRLQVGHKHRQAVLAELAPEQVPVAEQVIKGGIPAVRTALETQNVEARAEGRPELPVGPVLAIAEELLPAIRAAEWHDKADAALAAGDDVGLRDLRALVAAADAAARDDETRALAAQLRDALEQRRTAAREQWVGELSSALDEGRVLRALRLSGRGPEPGSRLPIELARRLSEAAGSALAADVSPDRWAALLDAVTHSPVRTTVRPAGLPTEPNDDVLSAARTAVGKVPALAGLLGMEAPAPTGGKRPPMPGAIPPPPASMKREASDGGV